LIEFGVNLNNLTRGKQPVSPAGPLPKNFLAPEQPLWATPAMSVAATEIRVHPGGVP
jgi:hypothetical protein